MKGTDVEAGMDRADRDLDLAVELVNTYWVLASPPDRLTDVGAWQQILRDAGEDALAGELRPDDLTELRELRDAIKPVFAAESAASAVALHDPPLRDAATPPPLVVADRAGRSATRAR